MFGIILTSALDVHFLSIDFRVTPTHTRLNLSSDVAIGTIAQRHEG